VKRPPTPRDEKHATNSGAEAYDDEFARAVADVIPLSPDSRGRVRPTSQIEQATPPAPSAKRSQADDIDESAEAEFVAPGIDRRELRNHVVRLLNFMMNPEIHGESDIERARRRAASRG